MKIIDMLQSKDLEMCNLAIITILSMPNVEDFISAHFNNSKNYKGLLFLNLRYTRFPRQIYVKGTYYMYIMGADLYFHDKDLLLQRAAYLSVCEKIYIDGHITDAKK